MWIPIGFVIFCVIFPFRNGMDDFSFSRNLVMSLPFFTVYMLGLFIWDKGKLKDSVSTSLVFTVVSIPTTIIFYYIGRIFA